MPHGLHARLCHAFLVTVHALHYSAKRGLEIARHLSVRLSVTLLDHDHIG